MTDAVVDPASFRDTAGTVLHVGDRIYRTVNPVAVADFDYVENTGLIDELVNRGWCLPYTVANGQVLGPAAGAAQNVLEHAKIPFISYPYEWPFSALKAAALRHLEVHLLALEFGVTLSDASAYNVQFLGTRPVFIDRLSFIPYHEGQFWIGHKQFCEQFLNPLLLRAILGVPHNAWFRGTQEGILTPDLNRLLPLRKKLSLGVLTHVLLQSRFQDSARRSGTRAVSVRAQKVRLPRPALVRMLSKLHDWIAKLEPSDGSNTVWADYAQSHSYAAPEVEAKKRFIFDFTTEARPETLWDLGCNTGEFSKVALSAGAKRAIGFDFDQGALDAAFARGRAEGLDLLPLFLDMANPSPSQGWAGKERKGLLDRADADALLALALIHHIAIGRNVPLRSVVEWLVALAPRGVIEFVPKGDPMVQELLSLRSDIFEDYNEEAFLTYLRAVATIDRVEQISESGRKLVSYVRRS